MTRAVPADPVNPLTNARRSKHVGTYSLKWGSWEGTRKASTPAAFMAARRDASFESGAAGGMSTTVSAEEDDDRRMTVRAWETGDETGETRSDASAEES